MKIHRPPHACPRDIGVSLGCARQCSLPASSPVIRVLVVDDHPAVRAGLLAILRAEPGLVPVGAASTADEAVEQAERGGCTVALVDYHLREEDGLTLCRALKALAQPPRVLIYSSFVTPALAMPASLAGADGLVDKGTPTDELLESIRAVSRGRTAMPDVGPELMQAAATRLDTEDLPILGMTLEGTPPAEIADVLRVTEQDIEARLTAMLSRLRVPTSPAG